MGSDRPVADTGAAASSEAWAWEDATSEALPAPDDRPTPDESLPRVPNRRARGLSVALFIVFMVLSAAAGYGGVLWWQARINQLDVMVEQTDRGQMLFVKPHARAVGMRVRFGERELLLGPSGVRFALDVESMRVGENQVALLLIDKHGRGRPIKTTILVPYRVRFDREGLNHLPMTLDFVIEVLPTSRVTVDNEPLALDAAGRGRKRYVIQEIPREEGPYEHETHYTIRSTKFKTIQGVLRLFVPKTAVQLSTPADFAVVLSDTIEVSGTTHRDAKVAINDQQVSLHDGEFRHRVPLKGLGLHTLDIVAQEPLRMPRRLALHVYRVSSLKQEATRFHADPRLTYRVIAKDPAAYRGQHIRIVGKVFNVTIEDGKVMLQMQARECDDELCPLWIALPTMANIQHGSTITVLGTIAGAQPFKTPSGKISTIPRIDAILAVPQ